MINNQAFDRFLKPKYIFWYFWLYAFLTAIFVQFILPTFLPHMFLDGPNGDIGLMNAGDWNFFHTAAIEVFAEMNIYGLDAWQILPLKQGPAGIAALHYWATGIPMPYVLIPMQSFLHGLAAFIFFKITYSIFNSKTAALISAILYLTMPFALLTYTQISKDVFFNLALLLFLYSLIALIKILFRKELTTKLIIRRYAVTFLATCAAMFLLFISRQHVLDFMQILIIAFYLLYVILFLIKKSIGYIELSAVTIGIAAVFLIINVIPTTKISANYTTDAFNPEANDYIGTNFITETRIINPDNVFDRATLEAILKNIPRFMSRTLAEGKLDKEAVESFTKAVQERLDNLSSIEDSQLEETQKVSGKGLELTIIEPWSRSSFLPLRVDNKLEQLYSYREYFYRYSSGATTIDRNLTLNSAGAMVMYLPKAIMHGLFSPSFSLLDDEITLGGKKYDHSSLLKVSILIMTLLSIPIFFSFFGVYNQRRNLLMWVMIVFAGFYLLYPVYAFPNIGAFMRHRYVPHMLIVSIGIYQINWIINKYMSKFSTQSK